MDATRFDDISRAVGAFGTRRRVLGALGSVTLGAGLAGILTPDAAGAKKSKAKKRRERKQDKRERRKKRKCRNKTDAQVCGTQCGTTIRLKACKRTVTCPSCGPIVCDPACEAPLTCCNGICVDTTRDRNNCGACGVAVAANELCLNSAPQTCTVSCTASNSTCVNTGLQTALTAGGTIYVCPGKYTGATLIAPALATTVIGAGSGEDITQNTALDGNAANPVFSAVSATQLDLLDLRIQNGAGSGMAAGGLTLSTGATVTATRITVTGNSHTANCGGGIATIGSGALILIDSLVEGNTQTADGGGLCVYNISSATLKNTIVRGNSVGGNGGGISMSSSTSASLEDGSLVTGNSATGSGGGYYGFNNTTQLTISADSAIVNNTPTNCAGSATITGTCTG